MALLAIIDASMHVCMTPDVFPRAISISHDFAFDLTTWGLPGGMV